MRVAVKPVRPVDFRVQVTLDLKFEELNEVFDWFSRSLKIDGNYNCAAADIGNAFAQAIKKANFSHEEEVVMGEV